MQTSTIPENQKPHADRDLVQMYGKANPARRFDCSTAFIGLRQLRRALACCVQEKAEYLAEGRTFNQLAAHWLFLRGIECSTVATSRPRYL